MHTAAAPEDDVDRLEVLLTKHAAERLPRRGLRRTAVMAAITYGRVAHIRGANIYAIGRREVAFWEREGIDLARYEGVQVVCSSDGMVLTVYRNHDFRGLRPRRRRPRRRSRARALRLVAR